MIKHLYIHIPFCDSICPYCDFSKRVSGDRIQKEYYIKLKEEIIYNKESFHDLETIFIGGGTPTSFTYFKELLELLNEYIDLSMIKEFSVETTPKRALDYLDLYSEYHINRISIGVESFDSRINSYIKRDNNDFENVDKIVKKLKEKNIKNINLDFIYSLPFSSIKTVKKDLEYIAKLDVTHVSFYDLILEDKTILSHDLKLNLIKLPDEDSEVKMSDLIDETMPKLGFHKYEISSWAKDNFESIHNKSYWLIEDYLGLGLNSHSLVDSFRFNNPSEMKDYLNVKTYEEYLKMRHFYPFEAKNEYFLLGLRLINGVSLSEYEKRFNSKPLDDFKGINKLIDEDLLVIENGFLKLTKKGVNLGNIVFGEFV